MIIDFNVSKMLDDPKSPAAEFGSPSPNGVGGAAP